MLWARTGGTSFAVGHCKRVRLRKLSVSYRGESGVVIAAYSYYKVSRQRLASLSVWVKSVASEERWTIPKQIKIVYELKIMGATKSLEPSV